MAVQAHLLPDFNLADKNSVCVQCHGSHNVGRIADVHTAILIPSTTSVALIMPLVACTCKLAAVHAFRSCMKSFSARAKVFSGK